MHARGPPARPSELAAAASKHPQKKKRPKRGAPEPFIAMVSSSSLSISASPGGAGATGLLRGGASGCLLHAGPGCLVARSVRRSARRFLHACHGFFRAFHFVTR